MESTRIAARLRSLEIDGFRGFLASGSLGLGDVTLLAGRNGLGKSTIFDALDWALFGTRSAFGGAPQEVLRGLWEPRDPEVRVTFENGALLRRTSAGATLGSANLREEMYFSDPALLGTRGCEGLRRLLYLRQGEVRDLALSTLSVRSLLLADLAGVPRAKAFASGWTNTVKDASTWLAAVEESVEHGSEAVEALSARIADLEARAPSLALQYERARELLGADPPADVPGLRGVLAQRASELREQCLGLEEQRGRLAIVQKAVEHRLFKLRSHPKRRLDLSLDLERARQIEIEAEKGRERSAQQETDAARAVEAAQLRHTESQRALEKARTEDRLRQEAATLAAVVEMEKSEAARVRGELATHVPALEEARARQAGLVTGLARARAELESIRSIREGEQTRDQSLDHARKVESECTREKAERAVLETALARTRMQLDEAKGRLLESDLAVDRMSALAADLEIIAASSDGRCPLCGHAHGAKEALLAAIGARRAEWTDSAVARRRVQELDLQAASAESAYAAQTERTESALARFDAARASLDRAETDLRKRIEAAGAREWSDRGLDAVQERTADATNRLAAARLEVEALELALSRLQEQLKRHESRQEDTESRREKLLGQIPTEAGAALERVESTENLAAAAQQAAAAAEAAHVLRGVRASESNLARQTAILAHQRRLETETALAELEKDRTTMETDVEGLIRPWPALAQPNIDLAEALGSLSDRLQSQAVGLSSRERRVAALLDELASAPDIRELDGLREEHRAATLALQQSRERQASLERALCRLREIREHVEKRIAMSTDGVRTKCDAWLNAILRWLNPHRHLNLARLNWVSGELCLEDPELDKPVAPELFTSTGQLQVLGLALFIATSWQQSTTPLRFVMLDDPTESLDDVPMAAFIDLVRVLAHSRQILISTSDRNAAALMKHKLGTWAVARGKKLVVHEFVDFDRHRGPSVNTTVIAASTTKPTERPEAG